MHNCGLLPVIDGADRDTLSLRDDRGGHLCRHTLDAHPDEILNGLQTGFSDGFMLGRQGFKTCPELLANLGHSVSVVIGRCTVDGGNLRLGRARQKADVVLETAAASVELADFVRLMTPPLTSRKLAQSRFASGHLRQSRSRNLGKGEPFFLHAAPPR
jgi:hypothetical protein